MTVRHLFGPVPSRRLGVSLGIDLTPGRACSFNCVYCECGATEHLTLERREYVPTDEVLDELRQVLAPGPALDSITFSGSGEPTLHSGIGRIIRTLKREFPSYRVTVLTNSSLLHLPDVRDDLREADLVIPSLDAVSEAVFLRMNRPVRGLTSALLLEGLRRFCDAYTGRIWLEIFIAPGVNDTVEEIALFREELSRLRVERVQLNALDRPGAVGWIRPATRAELERIAAQLGRPVDVVASRAAGAGQADALDGDAGAASPESSAAAERSGGHERDTDASAHETRGNAGASRQALFDRIVSTVAVRPCSRADLVRMLQLPEADVDALLAGLLADERIAPREELGVTMYVGRIGRHLAPRP